MSETLRRRFILVAVLCVFTVLALFLTFINLWSFHNVGEGADKTLSLITENNGYFPKMHKDKPKAEGMRPFSMPDSSPEAPFSTRYFSVTLDENGVEQAVNTGSIAAVTTEEATDMATAILAKHKAAGFYGVYRYNVSPEEDGKTLVVFLDCTRDLYNMGNFMLNSIYVGGAGFLAVCFLIVIFSKAAVRPVAESYEKQKIFITNAGHELKTPLAIIDANCEVIEMEHGDSQWLESIRNQTMRMARLTSQLTTLAKMEERQENLPMAGFSLDDVVKEVCDEMEAFAQSQGKTIQTELAPSVQITANEEQVRQLLYILLDNAVKHSSEGSPIHVALSPNGKLSLKNKATLETDGNLNLFLERFTRADTSRSRDTGGYGLGLSIAKAIVDGHKGKVHIFAPDKETLEITVKL